MPAPYSKDLRLRVMDAVWLGMTYEEITRQFRVSNSTILRGVRRLRATGSYAALPMGARSRSSWPSKVNGCRSGLQQSRT